MGFWDTATRIGEGAFTGGLSEAYRATYGKAADAQKDAYGKAGQGAADLGSQQRDWYGQQGKQALSYYGPAEDALTNMKANAPTQQSDYYKYMRGQAAGPTNQEQLYNERKGGVDPAAAYQDQRAMEQINQQLAARGMANSTPGVRQLTDYQANINAQRANQLAALAGGADNSRLGLDQAYGGAASGASGEQRGYYNDVMNSAAGLGDSKANTFGHFSELGGQAYSEGQKEKLQAALAAAGIDMATFQNMVGDVTAVGSVASNFIKPPATPTPKPAAK